MSSEPLSRTIFIPMNIVSFPLRPFRFWTILRLKSFGKKEDKMTHDDKFLIAKALFSSRHVFKLRAVPSYSAERTLWLPQHSRLDRRSWAIEYGAYLENTSFPPQPQMFRRINGCVQSLTVRLRYNKCSLNRQRCWYMFRAKEPRTGSSKSKSTKESTQAQYDLHDSTNATRFRSPVD